MILKLALQLAQGVDLSEEGSHLGNLVGVDQVVLENREPAGVLERVVLAVLLLQEVVDLRGGELVRVAAVDVHDQGVAGFDELARRPCATRQNLLAHGETARPGSDRRQLELALGKLPGEGE